MVFSGRGLAGRAQAGASAAKREMRVCACGRSSSHATIRSTLIAAAVATCCKWVFSRPQYRVRRSPKARTPCERVPSIPARCAYWRWPSALAYHARMAWRASYCSWGGSCRLRFVLRSSTGGPGRTGTAVLATKLHNDPGLVGAADVLRPTNCLFPLRTPDLLLPQSTVNWPTLYAPSTLVCQLAF